MQITVFQLGPLQTNCYIAADENTKACAVIDPGDTGSKIARWLREKGLTPRFILLTHGHFDHVGGVKVLLNQFPGLPVYVHPADTKLTPQLSRGLLWTDFYEEGDELVMDGISFRVLHTPGHTPGGVCYALGENLFTGDTMFDRGYGRTDLPGGDEAALMRSLRRLTPLRRTCRIFAGHEG